MRISRVAQSAIIFAVANFFEIVKNSRTAWKLSPAKINSLKIVGYLVCHYFRVRVKRDKKLGYPLIFYFSFPWNVLFTYVSFHIFSTVLKIKRTYNFSKQQFIKWKISATLLSGLLQILSRQDNGLPAFLKMFLGVFRNCFYQETIVKICHWIMVRVMEKLLFI